MPRKPPIVVLTIALSALMLIPTGIGWVSAVGSWRLVQTGEASLIYFLLMLVRTTSMLGLSLAVLYAGFRRPAWGLPITALFGALLLTLVVQAVLHPSPHPLFPLHGAAEEAGAMVARVFMILAAAAYVACLIFGGNARRYYGKTGEQR